MNRDEMREVVKDVLVKLQQDDAPAGACIFNDNPDPCDVATTLYGIGEED